MKGQQTMSLRFSQPPNGGQAGCGQEQTFHGVRASSKDEAESLTFLSVRASERRFTLT